MPFLGLDDSQRFSNLGKIWIFVVAAVALTSLTFFGSAVWNRINMKHESQPHADISEATMSNTDGSLLEPVSHKAPNIQELIEQVTSRLGKGEDRADSDADENADLSLPID